MLDYDDFVEKTLPSDLRFSKLFPNNLEKWIEYRDHETEKLLHGEYQKFASDMSNSEEDPTRFEFYTRLYSHLHTEERSLGMVNMNGYLGLGRWELAHLDQDGGTKKIETWTTRQCCTSLLSKEAWLKYGALAPEGFKPARCWTGPRGRDSRPVEPTDVVGLRPRVEAARSRWVTSFNAHGNTVLTITTVVVGKRQTKHDSYE